VPVLLLPDAPFMPGIYKASAGISTQQMRKLN